MIPFYTVRPSYKCKMYPRRYDFSALNSGGANIVIGSVYAVSPCGISTIPNKVR